MGNYLDFEKPLEDIALRIEELRRLGGAGDEETAAELKRLEEEARKTSKNIFSKLNRWQKTQIARHSDRPHSLDYVGLIAEDFVELHGDRAFSDDPAVVGGLGSVGGRPVMLIGHQKGRGVKKKIQRNFGQPHPEGYRKALRLMKLAEQFKKPVVTFIDTPGAYPGIGAEERGQAEAIATNLMEMSRLRTPIVSVVIGEGGSGGAIALGVADRLFMLEHSIYSVISPEGCASILWRKNGDLTQDDFSRAADALKLTAQDIKEFGIIDGIVPEPTGGAHRDYEGMARGIKDTVTKALDELALLDSDTLVNQRYERLRHLGSFLEKGS
jgi:acetyl-CoA carboxylase carboxyl transferase subunit alpha